MSFTAVVSPLRSLLLLSAGAALIACQRPAYPDFTNLVDEVTPSVVNISTVSISNPANLDDTPPASAPELQDSPFGDWFRRFFDERGEQPPVTEQLQAQGSGLILWEDGYILTNRHVVLGASEVVVRLWDRRQFSAAVVGLDERADLALLKIEAGGLPAVQLIHGKSSLR